MAANDLSPFYRVRQRVMARSCKLRGPERMVALAVASFFDQDGVCFPAQATIAERSGFSVPTVKRALDTLCDGPEPLFFRSYPKETKGHRHASCRYYLVKDPAAVARSRERREGRSERATKTVAPEVAHSEPPRVQPDQSDPPRGGRLSYAIAQREPLTPFREDDQLKKTDLSPPDRSTAPPRNRIQTAGRARDTTSPDRSAQAADDAQAVRDVNQSPEDGQLRREDRNGGGTSPSAYPGDDNWRQEVARDCDKLLADLRAKSSGGRRRAAGG